MQFFSAAITDIGQKRTSNQDSYLLEEGLGLYAVADGMGGHRGGATASRMAVEQLRNFYASGAGPEEETTEPAAALERFREAVRRANGAVYAEAQQAPELHGMGTTLVALKTFGRYGLVVHAGDSRLYRIHGTASVSRVTKDHSSLQEFLDANNMKESEFPFAFGRNIITRALGTEPELQVDGQVLELREDEGYLLCCDGLWNILDDDELLKLCTTGPPASASQIVARLVEEVNRRGANDNVTAVLLLGPRYWERLQESAAPAPVPPQLPVEERPKGEAPALPPEKSALFVAAAVASALAALFILWRVLR